MKMILKIARFESEEPFFYNSFNSFAWRFSIIYSDWGADAIFLQWHGIWSENWSNDPYSSYPCSISWSNGWWSNSFAWLMRGWEIYDNGTAT